MDNLKDPKNVDFTNRVKEKQETYESLLGDREWDLIEKTEETILFLKIGYGLFGPPSSAPTDENLETGYTQDQVLEIRKLASILLKGINFRTEDIHFACIFIMGKILGKDKDFQQPVFKLKKVDSDSGIYVDVNHRIYKNWKDYLKNNKLPKCFYCYPGDGKYEKINGKINLLFSKSPACGPGNKILKGLDIFSGVVTAGVVSVGVAALFSVPIVGPVITASTIAGGSTAIYSAVRSSFELADRKSHGQTIKLNNSEACQIWLSIFGSSLGFAQGQMYAAIARTARAGEVIGIAGRVAYVCLEVGSLTVNGAGIICGLAVIIDKVKNKNVSHVDIFQFIVSLLFFTNSAMSFKTASKITKEIHLDIIKSHRDNLTGKAKKLFNKHTGQLRGEDELHGNAKVVKSLNRIENTQDLYKLMVDNNVSNWKVKLTEKGYKGLLTINKILKIHPLALLEVPPDARQKMFTSTKNFSTGKITQAQLQSSIKVICKNYRISFQTLRLDTANKLCFIYTAKNVSDIVVNNHHIFRSAAPREFDQIRVILENTVQVVEIVLPFVDEFAKYKGCTTLKKYISYAETVIDIIKILVKAYDKEYEKALTSASALYESKFDKSKFNEDYGIVDSKNRYFTTQATEEIYDNGFDKLNQQIQDRPESFSNKFEPNILNDETTSYHLIEHDYFKKPKLTHEEYFKVVGDWFGNSISCDNAEICEEEDCIIISYFTPIKGVSSIKIDRSEDYAIVTVFYDTPGEEEEEDFTCNTSRSMITNK